MRDFLENIREIKESNETNEQERPFLQLELQNYEPKKKKVKEKPKIIIIDLVGE
jgi:hypothetical protein